MKTILDPSFRYTASFNTDLKRTFARIRREQHREQKKETPAPAAGANVASLVRRAAGRRD
jgi:hypothetical protein